VTVDVVLRCRLRHSCYCAPLFFIISLITVTRSHINDDDVAVVVLLVITLHKSPHQCSQLRCLVAASNGGRSSTSGLTSSQAGDHLTPSSHCWLQLLAPRLNSPNAAPSRAHNWLVMATGPRYIVSGRTARKTPLPQFLYCSVCYYCCDHVTVTDSSPSNGRLCWLNNSCFEQICHDIKESVRSGICPEGTEESHEESQVRVVSFGAEIWTRDLLNTKHEFRYNLPILRSFYVPSANNT
jgi:hypothetical protein